MRLILLGLAFVIFSQYKMFAVNYFTERIGTHIDSLERTYFEFFPEIVDFVSADFLEVNADSAYFIVKYREESIEKQKILGLNKIQLDYLNKLIYRYENLDNLFYYNNMYFDKFDFNRFSRDVIAMKLVFDTPDRCDLTLNTGEKVNAYVVWYDSLNIVVKDKKDDFNSVVWQDFNDLRVINLKDIKLVYTIFPIKIFAKMNEWKFFTKWYLSGTFFNDKKMSKELIDFLSNNKHRFQLEPTKEDIIDNYISDYYSHFYLEYSLPYGVFFESDPMNIRWRDPKFLYLDQNIDKIKSNPTKTDMFSNISIGYRFNRFNAVELSHHSISPTPKPNTISTEGNVVDLTYKFYLINELISITRLDANIEAGVLAGFGAGFFEVAYNYGPNYVLFSDDFYLAIKDKISRNSFNFHFGVFGNANITKNIAFQASLYYYYFKNIETENYHFETVYKWKPEIIHVDVLKSDVNLDNVQFRFGFRVNLR